MNYKNFHTHTVYGDGKDTPEQMVKAAIEQGFEALGFSEHSYTPCDLSYCMKTDKTDEYIKEIKSLKEKYAGKIRIYLGLEADLYFDGTNLDEFDYRIGSVHYIKVGDNFLTVDNSADEQKRDVEKYFGGSFDAYCTAYYEQLATVAEKTKASFIGHFDLVTKFNENDCLFSTKTPAYVSAWKNAADVLLKYNIPFEINTGAIARGKRITPYPAPEIARYITEKGGSLILSSDCHDSRFLTCEFDRCLEIYKDCNIVDFEKILNS